MMDGALSDIYHSFKGKYDLAKNVDDIFQNLQEQAKYLFAKKEDINRLISNSHGFMRKTCKCGTWLDDVKKIKQEVEDIQVRYQAALEHGQKLVNLPALAKLSEEMSKKTEEIITLKECLKPENILLVDNCVEVVEENIMKEINDIEAFNDIIEKLLIYINGRSSIRSVAVWGMAGVGKTTILKNLNHKVEKLRMFDIVIWITVSKEWSVSKLQLAIADKIRLNVSSVCSDYHMASLISKALEKKRYLVIMDEVFSVVDLRAIGILDTHENGKLVLATRYRSLCHKMDLDEDIKVERMSRVDAWNLFRKIVGEEAENPIFKLIAERILKECGELPQLIKVVGRMLRNKLNEDIWQGVLHKLQSSKDHQLEPMEEVLEIFRLVYDELDDNLKECLLYGASFPEDHEISQNYLIECWKAEELIDDALTFSNARQRGQILVETLIERYLLDRGKDVEHVKMPIIFRDMALRFTKVGNSSLFVVKSGERLGYAPVELWTDARVISLTDCDLRCLPSKPKNCVVTTLFLQKNETLTRIPPLFFSSLTCLRILDLSGTGIKSLPESIGDLTDLRGLYLNNCCELTVLCEHVSKLENLQLLEIFQSGLRCLPIYVGELRCLQCLKVSIMNPASNKNGSETHNVEMIPSNVVKKLSLLEELTIDVDPLDIRWEKVAPMVVKEVAALTMLNSLSFYFPTLECFEEFIRSSKSWKLSNSPFLNFKFRSFTFIVGVSYESSHLSKLNISICSAKRHLKYCAGIGTPQVISKVLKWVCVFEIVGHESVKYLTDFGADVLESLEICIIDRCDKLESAVGPSMSMVIVFPLLKELHLLKLKRLECLWEGPVMPKSFSRLTTLTLYDCPNVKKLFTNGMISHFQELEHLRIEKCCQVTEVIASDYFSAQILPSLKTLELIDLRSLVSICAGDLSEWPSLQRVEIIACEILVMLPFNNKNAMQLRVIHCSKVWWESLLQPELKNQLQKFCYFI